MRRYIVSLLADKTTCYVLFRHTVNIISYNLRSIIFVLMMNHYQTQVYRKQW
jgi:hypothetical protein